MTKEEIIDEIIEVYSKPGARSVNKEGRCLYKGPEGKMCAFAYMTKSEYRNQLTENRSAISCVADIYSKLENKDEPIIKEKYRGHELLFYGKLQQMHDCEEIWKDENSLKEYKNKILSKDYSKPVEHRGVKYNKIM